MQGSPGIGKTTCVLALAREMLGDAVKEGVLELNASDERYISKCTPSTFGAPSWKFLYGSMSRKPAEF